MHFNFRQLVTKRDGCSKISSWDDEDAITHRLLMRDDVISIDEGYLRWSSIVRINKSRIAGRIFIKIVFKIMLFEANQNHEMNSENLVTPTSCDILLDAFNI
jgi:putative cell wall-binding protein